MRCTTGSSSRGIGTAQLMEAHQINALLVTSGDAFAVDPAQSSRAARLSLGAAPSHAALSTALEAIASLMREAPEPARPVR